MKLLRDMMDRLHSFHKDRKSHKMDVHEYVRDTIVKEMRERIQRTPDNQRRHKFNAINARRRRNKAARRERARQRRDDG